MSKIRSFSQRHAVLFGILITLSVVVMTLLVGKLHHLMPDTLLSSVAFEIITIIWPVALVLLCGYGFIFREKGFGATLKAGMLYLILYGLLLVMNILYLRSEPGNQWQTLPNILIGVLVMIGIGIREEVLFRGLVANALALRYGRSAKGIWAAAVLSGVMFGALHMLNLNAGVRPINALIQSIGASGIGIIFAAIYLRGGNIWVLILIHSLIDAASLFESTFIVSTLSHSDQMNELSGLVLIGTVPIALLLSAFLFRKSKRPAILERLDGLRAKYGA